MTVPGRPMDRDQAYRLALIVEARARLDARSWVARLPRQVSVLARGRADQILEPDRDDPLRAALKREWYVRVFTDEARNRLGLGRPEVEVTPTETEHLAECLRAGVAYRIHGPGGSIVANPEGPEVVPGQVNFAERQADVDAGHGLTENQTRRVLEALADDQDRRRTEDQRIVGAAWDELTPEQRTAFAEYWHHQHDSHGHGAFPAAAPVRDVTIPTEPAAAARPTPGTEKSRESGVVDSGRRTPVGGRPEQAAAGVFGTEAADLAAARAAYALAAQAFPKSQGKPPTITSSGQVREGGGATLPDSGRRPEPPERGPDRSR